MQFLPLLWPDTVTDKLPQTQEIRHFPLITPSRVTSKLPSPHGTRGQKVRHLPGGLSELIHRCFCPLGRRGEYIDYILSEKTYQYPLICKVIIHSRQFCSKFKKCRHWFSWHPHWQYCSRRH